MRMVQAPRNPHGLANSQSGDCPRLPVARILVAGDRQSVAGNALLHDLQRQLEQDRHEAILAPGHEPTKEVRDADALVILLDHAPADAITLLAYAKAQQRPVLGLASQASSMQGFCTQFVTCSNRQEIFAALPAFYQAVRPFAGRLVRDLVPSLVEAAGHNVQFRKLSKEERPRFLKRKIAEEAQSLEQAVAGDEKEELADLLEALEAFMDARGYSRDEMKRVKEGKKNRRGAFVEGFVVESASMGPAAKAKKSPADPTQRPAAGLTPLPLSSDVEMAPEKSTTSASSTTSPTSSSTSSSKPAVATTAAAAAAAPQTWEGEEAELDTHLDTIEVSAVGGELHEL